MPAPTVATYSVAALSAANTELRTLLNGGKLVFLTSSDTELGYIDLQNPAGTINGTTGQLTFAFTAGPHYASASGDVAYAQFKSSGGTVHLSLPAEQGAAPVAGKLVVNSIVFVNGVAIDVISATVG